MDSLQHEACYEIYEVDALVSFLGSVDLQDPN